MEKTRIGWVDMSFRLDGTAVPLDHGYALFAAISRRVPQMHDLDRIGIHPIFGERSRPGILKLGPRSLLKVRVPFDEMSVPMQIGGLRLDIDGHSVRVARSPQIHPLTAAPLLRARYVTIKGFHEDAGAFCRAVRQQIERLAPDGDRFQVTIGSRRIMRIAEQRIVGYQVEIAGLSTQASLAVQIAGIGGRRRMGAGVFVPTSSEAGKDVEAQGAEAC